MNPAPSRPVPVPASTAAPPRNNGRAAPQPRVAFGSIRDGSGHRIVLYGPGGIGKTSLAATAPGPVAFFDLDDSLPRLRTAFAESGRELEVRPVEGAESWQDIRSALHATGWDDVRTMVIDSATRAEELDRKSVV